MGCGAGVESPPCASVKDVEATFLVQTYFGPTYCCYKPSSSGVLLVTIHGLGGTRNSVFFRDLPLHTRHATLRFDLAGHGRSGGELSLAMGPQICQIQELLRNSLFSRYQRRIYIGHSKGANVALCVAQPGDAVVCLAGRYFLDRFPRAMFSQKDVDSVAAGKSIVKHFGGKEFSVDRALVDELRSYDFGAILQQKKLQLTVIAAKHDFIANRYQQRGFEPFSSGGVKWISGGHFGFTYDAVSKVCGYLWEGAEEGLPREPQRSPRERYGPD